MKVLMLNGSPKTNGNTARALTEIGKQLNAEGIEYEIFHIAPGGVRDCTGCHQCTERGCVFEDDGVNEFIAKARQADGFVFGTPIYYAHPSGSILSFLDRVFYSSGAIFAGKPGAAVAVARRAGTTTAVEVLEKYLTISNMHSIGSSYWNIAFGRRPGDAENDAEGLQTMRNLARNMAWAIKLRDCAKQNGVAEPEFEHGVMTNFIR